MNVHAYPLYVLVFAAVTCKDAPPGDYMRLRIDGVTTMSNTACEYELNFDIVNQSHGDVLIGGLGLGTVPFVILDKPDVSSVTVIEKSPDVLKVVGSQLNHPKLSIIHADVNEWEPAGAKYNAIFFDIWQPLRPRDLPQVAALHQRFAKYLDTSDYESWLDSWQADFVRAVVAHYLNTGRVEAPQGWSQTPPALLAMCAEDLSGA